MRGVNIWDWLFYPKNSLTGFTGLHCAAYFGCVEIMAALLGTSKWDVQATDYHGNTALTWAAKQGHEGVVRLLLERRDVNANIPDTKDGRTPLSWAAENGHEGVVKMLLERNDVNPKIADIGHCRTPLLWAAQDGHHGVAGCCWNGTM